MAVAEHKAVRDLGVELIETKIQEMEKRGVLPKPRSEKIGISQEGRLVMSPPKSDPEQDTMKIVLLVAGAGGIGGFLSWVYAITVGQPPMLHSLLAIPASIALGAGAAFVGIFALAHTDTRVLTRCLAFAVLCGLSWKPIYDAGNALVKQSIRQQETKKELTPTRTAYEDSSQYLRALACREDRRDGKDRH